MAPVTYTPEAPNENSRRRAVLTAILKIIDIGVGLTALVGGVFAIVATPESVQHEVGLGFWIGLWGALLIVGGFCSALGRLVGVWILETVGIVGMAFGVLIYIAVILSVLQGRGSGQVVLAVCMFLVALLAMIRRYVELQIFLSEPEERGWIARLHRLLKLRLPDAPAHR